MEYYWLIIGGLLAFAVAWINGANNAGNAIGSAVGARALTAKKALWLAAVFDFLGAAIFGQYVSVTLMRGVVDASAINPPSNVVSGMCAALFATALWVFIATLLKVPMSISQAIVGGVLGFGLVNVGASGVNWSKVLEIVASWVYLPFMSMAVAIALYRAYAKISGKLTFSRLVALASLFTGITVFSTVFLLTVKAATARGVLTATGVSALAALAAAAATAVLSHFKLSRDLGIARESVFKALLIASCAAMAFSHGANDVANSAGPLAGIIYVAREGRVPEKALAVPDSAILLSAFGIFLGILMWGYRVAETIGEKITVLTVETAFIAQFTSSITVLIVTRMGLPVSTTVSIVGAIAGIGLARGVRSVNFKTLAKIILMWFLGFPVVAGISAGFTLLLR